VKIQEEVISDTEGKARRIIGTAPNITEQKQIEQELLYREAQLWQAQRIAHLGFWRTEPSIGGDKEFWSKEIYDIYGLWRTNSLTQGGSN